MIVSPTLYNEHLMRRPCCTMIASPTLYNEHLMCRPFCTMIASLTLYNDCVTYSRIILYNDCQFHPPCALFNPSTLYKVSPLPMQELLMMASAKKTGRRSLPKLPSFAPDDPIDQGTEVNYVQSILSAAS